MVIRKKRYSVKKTKQRRNIRTTSLSYCGSCGKKLIQNAVFCPHCGTSLEKAETNHGFSFSIKHLSVKNFLSKIFGRKFTVSPLLIISSLAVVVLLTFFAVNPKSIPLLLGCSDTKASDKAIKATVNVKTEFGTGSGFFIDKRHIVTNNHVVEDTTDVKIALYNGLITSGKVVGWDNKADIAIIEVSIDAPEILKWVSTKPQQGTELLAIGYPLNTEEPLKGDATVTKGTLSAYRKGLRDVEYIQTDTTINPGNSGGALVDTCGKVIGINTLTYKTDWRTETVFYAISAHSVKRLIDSFIKNPISSVPEGTLPAFDQDEDPEAIVAGYYKFVNEGNLYSAYSLFSNKRKKEFDPVKWQALFQNVSYISINKIEKTSNNPVTVEADVTLHMSDNINRLERNTKSTWKLKYSGGQLALDTLETESSETKAVFSTDYASITQNNKIATESLYNSIMRKDLSSYPASDVVRIKKLTTSNLEIINRLYDKVTSGTPFIDKDVVDIETFNTNQKEIQEINKKFENIDLQKYYDYYYR